MAATSGLPEMKSWAPSASPASAPRPAAPDAPAAPMDPNERLARMMEAEREERLRQTAKARRTGVIVLVALFGSKKKGR